MWGKRWLMLSLFVAIGWLTVPSLANAQTNTPTPTPPADVPDYHLYCTNFAISGTWPPDAFQTCQQIPFVYWSTNAGWGSALRLVDIAEGDLPCFHSFNIDTETYLTYPYAVVSSDYALVYRLANVSYEVSAHPDFYVWSGENDVIYYTDTPTAPTPLTDSDIRYSIYFYTQSGQLVDSVTNITINGSTAGVTRGKPSLTTLWNQYHTVYEVSAPGLCMYGRDESNECLPPDTENPNFAGSWFKLRFTTPTGELAPEDIYVSSWSVAFDEVSTPLMCEWVRDGQPPAPTATPGASATPIATTSYPTPVNPPTPFPPYAIVPLPGLATPIPAPAIPGIVWPTITVPTVGAPPTVVLPTVPPGVTLTPTPSTTPTPQPTTDAVATLEAYTSEMATRWAEPVGGMYPYVAVISGTGAVTQTNGISTTVDAINFLVGNIVLPIRLYKSIQYYSPATAVFWTTIFICAGLIITSYFAKFGLSIVLFVLEMLRKLWEMIPFN